MNLNDAMNSPINLMSLRDLEAALELVAEQVEPLRNEIARIDEDELPSLIAAHGEAMDAERAAWSQVSVLIRREQGPHRGDFHLAPDLPSGRGEWRESQEAKLHEVLQGESQQLNREVTRCQGRRDGVARQLGYYVNRIACLQEWQRSRSAERAQVDAILATATTVKPSVVARIRARLGAPA